MDGGQIAGKSRPRFSSGLRAGVGPALGGGAHADLYVGGKFHSYQSRTVDFLAAVNANGSRD